MEDNVDEEDDKDEEVEEIEELGGEEEEVIQLSHEVERVAVAPSKSGYNLRKRIPPSHSENDFSSSLLCWFLFNF